MESYNTHAHNTVFGDYRIPATKFKGITRRSIYLPMPDGVKIALELVLPKNLGTSDRIPTLLSQTRYWRTMELNPPFKWLISPDMVDIRNRGFQSFFTGQGYALVYADVRGTGASFGSWPYPWSQDSIQDSREIVDWIIAQPWSDGNVGGYGISYLGTTAELLSILQHPAVKATLPMFNHPDAYIDIAYPGGIYNQRFVQAWANFDRHLDQNTVPQEFGFLGRLLIKGVKPVDGDQGKQLLKHAIHDHQDNGDVHKFALSIEFRDQPPTGEDMKIESLAIHQHKTIIEGSPTVSFGWGSWMDAGTADAVIRRFLTYDNNQRAVIGAWEHGGSFHASPYQKTNQPSNPPPKDQWREILRFFDAYLKNINNGVQADKLLFYYTMGEEKWKVTPDWPPNGVNMETWFFQGNNQLSNEKPISDQGADTYTVDFEASTDLHNRWWSFGALEFKSVFYPDRAGATKHLLCYTSPPLGMDIEITGHPIVTLFITSSETDGAFYVYLEDIHQDGKVTYITEGQLRAIHRKVSQDEPPHKMLVPYHSFKQKDALTLIPGEVAKITFGLNPTSVLIRKGHRIRVSLAGHDKDTFERIPHEGTPTITVERNNIYASCIELPIIASG
jgi:putative CocE/NonD family hydrolase